MVFLDSNIARAVDDQNTI